MDQTLDLKPWRGMSLSRRLSFAKTRSLLVSTAWEMGCNVVGPGYMRPRPCLEDGGEVGENTTTDCSGHAIMPLFQD